MKIDIKPDVIESWSEIDWKLVNSSVTKLRRRIFDAKRNNKNKSLTNLQKLMLNSTSNILHSIRKISSNSGNRTPGIDGETLQDPRYRMQLFNYIVANGWNGIAPKPIRRIYIIEASKFKPIGIPPIYDRVIQAMICNALEPEWEAIFEKGSYGFRPKRKTNDALSRIWLALNKPGSRQWIVDTDISKCFDSISHDYLLNQLKGFPGKNLIKEMLELGSLTRVVSISSDGEGTPQGSPLSPLLCNIALHGLEEDLGVKYTKKGYVSQTGRLLIRFADDLVIICKTRGDALAALEILKKVLIKRGLTISDLKTKIVHITEGFDFLGYNIKMSSKPHISCKNAIININDNEYRIDHKNVGVYVSPSRKSVKKIKTKLKEVLVKSKGSSPEKFVKKLNPIIRGYVLAKRHWHSNKVFRELDNYIYILCWRWAIRQHPQKSSDWIRNKYFKHLKFGLINNKWVFTVNSSKGFKPLNPNNSFISKTNLLIPRQIVVYKTSWFKIRDYIVGKMDKLPDNRNDIEYFKDLEYRRLLSQPFNIFRKIDRDIAISQRGICPICEENLFNDEKIHLHHIIPRKNGGKTTFNNLVFLHTVCHSKIHSNQKQFNNYFDILQSYKRSQPRPDYFKMSEREVEMPSNGHLNNLI